MDRTEMIARLMAEAKEDGCKLVMLRAIVEEATDLGADCALQRTGLGDSDARNDLAELRELLRGWRDVKASVQRAALAWLVRGMLALALIGVAARLGVTEVLQ